MYYFFWNKYLFFFFSKYDILTRKVFIRKDINAETKKNSFPKSLRDHLNKLFYFWEVRGQHMES